MRKLLLLDRHSSQLRHDAARLQPAVSRHEVSTGPASRFQLMKPAAQCDWINLAVARDNKIIDSLLIDNSFF